MPLIYFKQIQNIKTEPARCIHYTGCDIIIKHVTCYDNKFNFIKANVIQIDSIHAAQATKLWLD